MEKIFDVDYDGYKKNRKWLIGLLEGDIVEITFTKKDGTDRVLRATLQEDYLPETVGSDKERNTEVLAVYDVENEGWRSFRWDSVKEIKFSIGEEENA